MKDIDSDTTGESDSNIGKRPDLDGEEYRDSTYYKPISTREYFKVLCYCLLGFVAIGLAFIIFAIAVE